MFPKAAEQEIELTLRISGQINKVNLAATNRFLKAVLP